MRRFIRTLAACALLTPPSSAHADPTIPDFNAYAESEMDYRIYDPTQTCNHTKQLCGAFYTSSGFICEIRAIHIGFTANCRGPKPGAEGTTLKVSSFGSFNESPAEAGDSDRAWLGQPIQLLPSGQRIGEAPPAEAGESWSCVTDETWLLACALGTDGKLIRGFAVTEDGYDSFHLKSDGDGYVFQTH